MKHYILYIFAFVCFLASCDWFGKRESENVIARVGDQYLYEEDLEGLTSSETITDSAQIVDGFIDNWVKEQLLLQKAKQNLTEQQLDFEKQMENYRKSLIIYAYENELVRQKLDTSILEEEIKSYYKDNPSNFELKTPLFKARFIRFINSAPNQDSLRKWFFDSEEQERLNEYCTQFALNCQLEEGRWINKTEWKNLLPKDTVGKIVLPELGESIQSDSTFSIFIKIEEIKKQGEVAPISFVRKQIKSIIRNQRRLKLITDVKQEIFEEATLKKKYEVYE